MSASFDPKFIHFSTVASSSLLTGLVAYYTMNEASGTLYDSTGNNNITTFTGSYGATGKLGNCVSFAGSTQYATVPNASNFTSTAGGSLSINLWIYMTNAHVTNHQMLFGSNSAYGPEFYLPEDQGTNQYDMRFKSGTQAAGDNTATTYAATTWYMLTCVKSGTTVTFYRNGAQCGTPSTLTSDLTETYTQYIGGDPSSEAFPGRIDEVGYWSRALTTGEITTLYNAGVGKTYPFS